MEPPESTEQAVQLDTERDISKGADDSKSEASGGKNVIPSTFNVFIGT
jgi:hypothetical protein